MLTIRKKIRWNDFYWESLSRFCMPCGQLYTLWYNVTNVTICFYYNVTIRYATLRTLLYTVTVTLTITLPYNVWRISSKISKFFIVNPSVQTWYANIKYNSDLFCFYEFLQFWLSKKSKFFTIFRKSSHTSPPRIIKLGDLFFIRLTKAPPTNPSTKILHFVLVFRNVQKFNYFSILTKNQMFTCIITSQHLIFDTRINLRNKSVLASKRFEAKIQNFSTLVCRRDLNKEQCSLASKL